MPARSKQSSKVKTDHNDGEPELIAGRDRRAVTVFLLLSICLLVTDLLVKYLSFKHISPSDKIIVIPYLLALQLTKNYGAVFGMGQGGKWFFVVVSIVAVAVIGRAFCKSDPKARWYQMSLAMVLAGGSGPRSIRVCARHDQDLPRCPSTL